MGDSITHRGLASCEDTLYHAVLKKEVGLALARNYGMGGTRFAIQKGNEKNPRNDNVDTNSFCERFEKMDDDA